MQSTSLRKREWRPEVPWLTQIKLRFGSAPCPRPQAFCANAATELARGLYMAVARRRARSFHPWSGRSSS